MGLTTDNNIIPSQKKEKAAFLLLFLGVPFAFIWDFLVVTPAYYDSTSWIVIAHYASELFIIINILGNFYMAIKQELVGAMKIKGSTHEKPGWRYCDLCKLYLPPRSYHCKTCNACSLKRDHHCAYLGTCVSYFNLRYFIVAVLYVWIGAVYGLIYYLPYYIDVTKFTIYTLLQLLAPHISFFLGFMTSYTFLSSVFLIIIILVLAFSTVVLYEQMWAIIKGQTQWERKHDIKTYDVGFYKNLKQALGERWYLVWIFPTIESPVICDGITFAQS